MKGEVEFKVNFDAHAGQIIVNEGIAKHNPNILVLDCCRGWGKTLYVTCDILIPKLLQRPNVQAMWVAPTHTICRSPIDDVWNGVDEDTNERYVPQYDADTRFQFWEHKKQDKEIHLFNGSKIFFRSAESPESIVSKGFSIIIIDEGALIYIMVYQQQILATARRKNVVIVIMSTPRGRNSWFYHKFLEGQDPAIKNVLSYKMPWWTRPDYPPFLIEEMKKLPANVRKQEFEAEFVGDSVGVFKNLDSVFYGEEIEFFEPIFEWVHPNVEEYKDKHDFIISLDPAKEIDYTVIIGMTITTREIIYVRRVNSESYKTIIEYTKKASNLLNGADLIFDATGVGAGIADQLEEAIDSNVHRFVFSNKSKTEMINKLIVATDYNNIQIPYIRTVRNEFEIFQFVLTRTNKISYSAPEGKNDDCVIAIGMANWYVEEHEFTGEAHAITTELKALDDHYNGQTSFLDFIENDND